MPFKGELKNVTRVVAMQPISDCGLGYIHTDNSDVEAFFKEKITIKSENLLLMSKDQDPD